MLVWVRFRVGWGGFPVGEAAFSGESLTGGEGSALSAESFGDNLPTMLSSPLVSILLGVLAGTAIALVNRYGVKFMTPDDTTGAGIGMAMGLYTVGLIVAAGLLFAYRTVAPAGFPYFGIALVASLLVVTILALVPAMRALRAGEKGR